MTPLICIPLLLLEDVMGWTPSQNNNRSDVYSWLLLSISCTQDKVVAIMKKEKPIA